MARERFTDPAKVGTFFARTTKGGNWQVGQYLPSGFVLIAQNISNADMAQRIARLLNSDHSSQREWEALRVKTNEERIAREAATHD